MGCSNERFVMDMELDADNHELAGMHAFAAGIRHTLVALQARQPGTLPVVDANDLTSGYWDDEYFVAAAGPAPAR